jgi:hypothetical protein
MTHLEILKQAFDAIGIKYFELDGGMQTNALEDPPDEHQWTYIFLGDKKPGTVDELSITEHFFEFMDGQIASY